MRTFIKFILHYLDPRSTFIGLLIACVTLSCGIYFFFKEYLEKPLSDEIFWPAALAATGYILIKFLETRTRRYNTLCCLEVELNQSMDTLSLLIMALTEMLKNQVPLLMPQPLPNLTIDYLNSVGRIDVKNNLADLLCDFKRINQMWNNFLEIGNQNTQVLHDPKHPDYQLFRMAGINAMNGLLHRCRLAFKLIEDTLVLVRIYMPIDKSFFRFKQPFVWPCEMSVEIEKERKKLVSERQSNQ